jgi:hypothetical protein
MDCQFGLLVGWVRIWVSGTLGRVSTKRRLRGSDRPYRFNPVTKRPLCRWCGKDVPPPKLTFCGPECVHEYLLRSDPRYLRQKVFERDRGVCSVCKLDTMQIQRELSDVPYGPERNARKIALGLYEHRNTFWDADHIQPVSEGGGVSDGPAYFDNMQTLCLKCHGAKSSSATTARRKIGRVPDPPTLHGSGVRGEYRASVLAETQGTLASSETRAAPLRLPSEGVEQVRS